MFYCAAAETNFIGNGCGKFDWGRMATGNPLLQKSNGGFQRFPQHAWETFTGCFLSAQSAKA